MVYINFLFIGITILLPIGIISANELSNHEKKLWVNRGAEIKDIQKQNKIIKRTECTTFTWQPEMGLFIKDRIGLSKNINLVYIGDKQKAGNIIKNTKCECRITALGRGQCRSKIQTIVDAKKTKTQIKECKIDSKQEDIATVVVCANNKVKTVCGDQGANSKNICGISTKPLKIGKKIEDTEATKKLKEKLRAEEDAKKKEEERRKIQMENAKRAIELSNKREQKQKEIKKDELQKREEELAKQEELYGIKPAERRSGLAREPKEEYLNKREANIKSVENALKKLNKEEKQAVDRVIKSSNVTKEDKQKVVQKAVKIAKLRSDTKNGKTSDNRCFLGLFCNTSSQNTVESQSKDLIQTARQVSPPTFADNQHKLSNNWEKPTINTPIAKNNVVFKNVEHKFSDNWETTNNTSSVINNRVTQTSPDFDGQQPTTYGLAGYQADAQAGLQQSTRRPDGAQATYGININAPAPPRALQRFTNTSPGSNPFPKANNSNSSNNTPPPGGYGGAFPSGGGFSSGSSNSSGGGSSAIGSLFSGIGKFLGQKLAQQAKPKQKAPVTPPKPSCRVFTATERVINPGESTTLQYAMAYSDYAEISGIGSVDPRGGIVRVSPSSSTTYTLQAQNRYGSGSCPAVRITVLADSEGGDDVFDSGTVVKCSPQSVVPGASAIVLWQCPSNATTSLGSSTEYGEFNTFGRVEGSVRVAPSETSKFVVQCRDESNREVGRSSCKLQVGEIFHAGGDFGGGASGGWDTQQPRAELTTSKRQVSAGETVTISWEGFGTNNCTITGPDGFKELGNKGSVTGRMLQTSTFELSCSAGGQDIPTESVTIQVI